MRSFYRMIIYRWRPGLKSIIEVAH